VAKAQERVEGYNFDLRKHLLEYDDVLNKQREKIYRLRDGTLEESKEELEKEIFSRIEEELKELSNLPAEEAVLRVKNIFPLENEDLKEKTQTEIFDYFLKQAKKNYENLKEILKTKEREIGLPVEEFLFQYEKALILRTLDFYWTDYLSVLSNLQKGIGLRAYGQHDPLVEYKREAKIKFSQLQALIRKQVVYNLYKIANLRRETSKPEALKRPSQKMWFSGPEKTSGRGPLIAKKIGRNDPCPCGKINPQTGKPMKYKKCCYPKFG